MRPRTPRCSCPRWSAGAAGREAGLVARPAPLHRPGRPGPLPRRHPPRRPGAGPGRRGPARSAPARRPAAPGDPGGRGPADDPHHPAGRRPGRQRGPGGRAGGGGCGGPLHRPAGRRRAQPGRRRPPSSSRWWPSAGPCGPRSAERSFGNHRATILAALANAGAARRGHRGSSWWSASTAWSTPRRVDGRRSWWSVAAVGLVANGVAALVLRDADHDLNMRAVVRPHGRRLPWPRWSVLVAGAVIAGRPAAAWDRLDPVAALVVAALIVVQAVRLVRASVDVLLESTPADVDLDRPAHGDHRRARGGRGPRPPRVEPVERGPGPLGPPGPDRPPHPGGGPGGRRRVRAAVAGPFDIAHTTLELECERCVDDDDDPCAMGEVHRPLGGAPTTTWTAGRPDPVPARPPRRPPGPGRDAAPSNRPAEAVRAPRGHALGDPLPPAAGAVSDNPRPGPGRRLQGSHRPVPRAVLHGHLPPPRPNAPCGAPCRSSGPPCDDPSNSSVRPCGLPSDRPRFGLAASLGSCGGL